MSVVEICCGRFYLWQWTRSNCDEYKIYIYSCATSNQANLISLLKAFTDDFSVFSRFLFQVSLSSLAVDSERFLFFFFIFGIYHSLIVLFLLQIQMVNMSVDNCEHIMRCSKGMIITFDKNRSGSSAVSGGSGCRRTLIFCAVHHQMIISAYVWHEPNKRVK